MVDRVLRARETTSQLNRLLSRWVEEDLMVRVVERQVMKPTLVVVYRKGAMPPIESGTPPPSITPDVPDCPALVVPGKTSFRYWLTLGDKAFQGAYDDYCLQHVV